GRGEGKGQSGRRARGLRGGDSSPRLAGGSGGRRSGELGRHLSDLGRRLVGAAAQGDLPPARPSSPPAVRSRVSEGLRGRHGGLLGPSNATAARRRREFRASAG